MTDRNEFADKFDLDGLRDKLDREISDDLTQALTIIHSGLKYPSHIYAREPKWTKIEGAVAVFADLRNSTQLNVGQHPKTTAHVYEAATGGMVETMSAFEPGFIDIQGDGVFGIFTGGRRVERALCAAITLRTFSEQTLFPALSKKWPKLPETGIKVGVASGDLLVKKIGIWGENAPVWSGTPVNFAAKCAQSASAHEVVITPKVYEKIAKNDFLAWTCGCPGGGSISQAWDRHPVPTLVSALREDCRKLTTSGWCREHGAEYCAAVLRGQKNRGLGVAA